MMIKLFYWRRNKYKCSYTLPCYNVATQNNSNNKQQSADVVVSQLYGQCDDNLRFVIVQCSNINVIVLYPRMYNQ